MDTTNTTVRTEPLSFIDLVEHYLTSPTSPARFTGPASPDLTLAFTVNGLDYENFCDLVARLGWELVESRELAEESHGGWADITITHRRAALRRSEPRREYALGYRDAATGWVHRGANCETTPDLDVAVEQVRKANERSMGPFIVVYRDAAMWRAAPAGKVE